MATERRDLWANTPGPSVVTFGFDVLDRVEQAPAVVKERVSRRLLPCNADRARVQPVGLVPCSRNADGDMPVLRRN
jgi:hypothetical protein